MKKIPVIASIIAAVVGAISIHCPQVWMRAGRIATVALTAIAISEPVGDFYQHIRKHGVL